MLEINRTEIEVRYKETDQMGVVHHSNYIVWFEVGRTKYMNQVGFNYAEMERDNLLCPVIDIEISYKKPLTYGDTAMIETWLDNYDGIRITYGYKIYNEKEELCVRGKSRHVVVKKDNFRPVIIKKVNPTLDEAYKNLVIGER